jgi:predicted ester cyclase
MSTEENKALIRRFIEVGNRGNVTEISTTLDELFVPDFVRHDPAGGFRSREDYKRFLFSLLAALPGQFTIEDLIAEGDKVVLRYTFRGIHQGQWRGLPPTGKPVTFTGIFIYRMVDGKIVEGWENADALGLVQQLGLIPAQG